MQFGVDKTIFDSIQDPSINNSSIYSLFRNQTKLSNKIVPKFQILSIVGFFSRFEQLWILQNSWKLLGMKKKVWIKHKTSYF